MFKQYPGIQMNQKISFQISPLTFLDQLQGKMLGKLAVVCSDSFLLLEETVSLPSPAPPKSDVATIHDLVHAMLSEVTFRSRHIKLPGNDHFPPSRKMQIIAIDYDRATRGKGSGSAPWRRTPCPGRTSFFILLECKINFFLESF